MRHRVRTPQVPRAASPDLDTEDNQPNMGYPRRAHLVIHAHVDNSKPPNRIGRPPGGIPPRPNPQSPWHAPPPPRHGLQPGPPSHPGPNSPEIPFQQRGQTENRKPGTKGWQADTQGSIGPRPSSIGASDNASAIHPLSAPAAGGASSALKAIAIVLAIVVVTFASYVAYSSLKPNRSSAPVAGPNGEAQGSDTESVCAQLPSSAYRESFAEFASRAADEKSALFEKYYGGQPRPPVEPSNPRMPEFEAAWAAKPAGALKHFTDFMCEYTRGKIAASSGGEREELKNMQDYPRIPIADSIGACATKPESAILEWISTAKGTPLEDLTPQQAMSTAAARYLCPQLHS